MKTHRHLLLAAIGISLAAPAQSQITINNSTAYPGVGRDTARQAQSPAGFAGMGVGGTNQSWDFSAATYASGLWLYSRFAPTNPAFPGAVHSRQQTTSFSGFSYSTEAYYTRDASGIKRIGEEVFTRQAIFIGALTFGPNDSLVFPVQTISYTGGPLVILPFPATYGTSWNSSASYTLNFNITAAAASLNNAPGQRRTQRTHTDSVTGWGRIMVKDPVTNLPSGWMDVLQVRSRLVVRDSFYLNGAPASPTLMGAFGLQQGQYDTSYTINFMRPDEYSPVVEMRYAGGAMPASNTPTTVLVNQTRLASPSSVGGVTSAAFARVFPNPVRGSKLAVQLPDGVATYRYRILSVSGATVGEGSAKTNTAGETAVTLPQSTAPGMYYLMLDGIGEAASAPLIVPFEVAE